MNVIEYRIEDALAAIIKARLAADSVTLDVVTGVNEAVMAEGEGVLVRAERAEAVQVLAPGYGNFNVLVSIKVFSNFADRNTSRETHYARVNAVRDALMADDLRVQIDTQIGEGVTFGHVMLTSRSTETLDRCWVHTTEIIVPAIDGAGTGG